MLRLYCIKRIFTSAVILTITNSSIRSTERGIGRSRSFRSELSSTCLQLQNEVVTIQPTSSSAVTAIVSQPRPTATRTNSDDALNKAVSKTFIFFLVL